MHSVRVARQPLQARAQHAGAVWLLAIFAGALLAASATVWWLSRSDGAGPLGAAEAPAIVAPLGRATLAPLVARAGPAVVSIAVVQSSPAEQNPLLRDPLYRRFFGVPDDAALQPRLSAGSGVVVDAARGLIVTNYHVVRGARAIEVALTDRRHLEAELVGVDELTDIALLRVRATGLTALPFADTSDLQVGDYVVAIGNPFGLGQSATAGIVSALGRAGAHGYENYIQTDAPINPGNSGGPLINLQGEIVGINSAIFSAGQGNIGIGFAVPANIAGHVVEQILEHGEVRRGQIGVVLRDTLPTGRDPPAAGVEVAAVQPGSAAAEAGLRPGDVIVAARGQPTPSATAVRNAVGLTEIGESIPLEIRRGSERLDLSIPVRPGPRPEGEQPLRLVR